MQLKTIILFTGFLFGINILLTAQSINYLKIDSVLAKKITISGICLCKTTLRDLQKTGDFEKIKTEEISLPNDKSLYVRDESYYSKKYPGVIFQIEDPYIDRISKIRITKNFTGNLPDGTNINFNKLKLKDVFSAYPEIKNKKVTAVKPEYICFSNDTISVYIKADPNAKTQNNNESYYLEKPVVAIELAILCHKLVKFRTDYRDSDNNALIYLDSVLSNAEEINKYTNSNEIESINIVKGDEAIKIVGEKGKNGIIYVNTKKSVKK